MTSIATDSWEEQATEIRFSRKVREIHSILIIGSQPVSTMAHSGPSWGAGSNSEAGIGIEEMEGCFTSDPSRTGGVFLMA